MANNYKVKMVDLQNKYKFKIFCSSQMYDDTELKRQLDTIYKAFPKASATGTSANLTGTAAALMNIGLKGNGSQTGTPTPASPIPVNVVSGDNTIDICGKNLFDIEGRYETGTGITLTKNNDGSYTLNGTANGNNFFRGVCYLNEQHTISYTSNTENANVLIRTRTGTPSAQTGIQDQLAVSSTSGNLTSSKQFDFVEISIVSGTTLNNFKIYIQLEKGTAATAYEPYTGASYPINLGVKNLFDKSTATLNKGIATANGGLYNSDINFSTDYIEVKTNGTYYTASGVSSVANRVYGAQYDSNKQYVGAISTNVGQKTLYISNANVKYIRLTGLLEEIDTYQIEEGSKTNSYTPYGTIPLELCKIGDYQDYIYKEGKKWYIEKQIGKVVLNGNSQEIWSKSGATTESSFVGAFNLVTTGISNKWATGSSWLCDKFVYGSLGVDYKFNTYNGDATQGYIFFGITIPTSLASDINTFRTWLGNNNVTLYYVLAEPTTEEITDATLISQLEALRNAESYEGQTNISQTNNDLPFIITASAIKDLSNL